MDWCADINLRSGKNIIVEKLQSIAEQHSADNGISKITDYGNFFLQKNRKLSFIGERKIATLWSDEIEYVEFKQCD